MHMQVEHRLTGRAPDVDPEVVPAGAGPVIETLLDPIDELEQGVTFLGSRVEPRRDMSFRNDQDMAGRNRECVVKGRGEGVLLDHAVCGRGAEGARGRCAHGQSIVEMRPAPPATIPAPCP